MSLLKQPDRTEADYPAHKTLHGLFREQAEKTPFAVALVCGDQAVTYDCLDDKANRLAGRLRDDFGVCPGDIVALCMERSIDIAIAVIAVLKAGAVCLTIDTKNPIDRIHTILRDSGTKMLLVSKGWDIDEFMDTPGPAVVHVHGATLDGYPAVVVDVATRPGDPVYIIYSSGSTGMPKGVILNSRGVVNHLFAILGDLDLGKGDVFCHNLSFSYVVSVWQIFGPLVLGSTLHIYDDHTMSDAYRLFSQVEADGITVLELIPAFLHAYLQALAAGRRQLPLKKMRTVILTGEKIPAPLPGQFYARYSLPLLNAYGQSEYSDDTLFYWIPRDLPGGEVPIGEPIQNTRVYVVDEDDRRLSVGVPGELCVAGHGLSSGYLNRPELTAEKFVPDPFQPGQLMFRSGDLVELLPDGNLAFLGRKDFQVKIRGYRIEPGEIENRLQELDYIDRAVVVAREKDGGDRYLAAYLTPAHPEQGALRLASAIASGEIRRFLAGRLPDYMIPTYFAALEKMPLTTGGKVDRKRLPDPVLIATGEVVPPQNENQAVLVDIWAEVLHLDRDKIGIDTNFFHLGGHSLTATTMMTHIYKEFAVDLPLSLVFEAPTVGQLALHLDRCAPDPYAAIPMAEEKEYYPLSSAQESVYIMHHLQPHSLFFNMQTRLHLAGDLHRERLQSAFCKLVERHEAFRTSFHTIADRALQKIHHFQDIQLNIEYGPDPDTFVRPFDLSDAPLLRLGLTPLGDQKNYLVVDMHHIIYDGVSIDIYVRELLYLYGHGPDSAGDLPQLRLQYKDYAEWQKRAHRHKKLNDQKEYWIKKFAPGVPRLNIPGDPGGDPGTGGVEFEIDKQDTVRLKELALSRGATPFMVLLAALSILLARVSGCIDVVIGTPVAGRRHPDLANVIGMFINMLPLWNRVLDDKFFADFLEEVKSSSLEAFENQDYRYEELVEQLLPGKRGELAALFDVVFIFQNLETKIDGFTAAETGGLTVVPQAKADETAKFPYDMVFTGAEADGGLTFVLSYRKERFKRETVELTVTNFKAVLAAVLDNPLIPVEQIPLSHGLTAAQVDPTDQEEGDFDF